MKIIFMGTPDFSVPALERIIEKKHEIIAVYTRTPSPSGRGQHLRKTPVHEVADKYGIPVRTPETLKGEGVQKDLAEMKADIAVVVAYGLLLPEKILKAPKYGCINIHASLLPRWRGAAPIQRAIMEGDKETGVTIMQMDKGLDTGDMLLMERISIEDNTNAQIMHDGLSLLGAEMVVRALDGISEGSLKGIKQPTDGVTYAKKLTKEDERINWNNPAWKIECQIRGLAPRPGAFFTYKGEIIKILEADYSNKKTAAKPGEVIDDGLTIACGDGIIIPIKVQRQGRNMTDVNSFLRGFNIESGAILD